MIKDEEIQEMEQEINKRKNKLTSLYKVLDQTQKEIEGEKLIIKDLEEKLSSSKKLNKYTEILARIEDEDDESYEAAALYVKINNALYAIDEYILKSYKIESEGQLIYRTKDPQELIEEINDSINSYYANYLNEEESKNTFINLSINIDGFYFSNDRFIKKDQGSLIYSWLYDEEDNCSYSKEQLLSIIQENDFFNETVKIIPEIEIFKKYNEVTTDRLGSYSLKAETINWNEFTRLLRENNWIIDYDIEKKTDNDFTNKSIFSPKVNAILDNPTLIKDKHKEKKITL